MAAAAPPLDAAPGGGVFALLRAGALRAAAAWRWWCGVAGAAHAPVPGMPPADASFPRVAVRVVAMHAAARAVYFAAVRGLFAAAERYSPGTIQRHVWMTYGYCSHFVSFFGPTLRSSAAWFVAADAGVLLLVFCACRFPFSFRLRVASSRADWARHAGLLRGALANRRATEVEMLRALLSIPTYPPWPGGAGWRGWAAWVNGDDGAAPPAWLVRPFCTPGEDVDLGRLCAARRGWSPAGIVHDAMLSSHLHFMRECFVHQRLATHSLGAGEGAGEARHTALTVLLRLCDFLVPILCLEQGVRLGARLRGAMGWDMCASGTRYNTGHALRFVGANAWRAIRIGLVPRLLRQAPVPGRVPRDIELAEQYAAQAFSSLPQEYLDLLRLELDKVIRGEQARVQMGDRPIRRREAARMSAILDRHERRRCRRQAALKAATRLRAIPRGGPASECSICLAEYEAAETVRELPCGHLFHPECVDRWLVQFSASRPPTCPKCREELPEGVCRRDWVISIGFAVVECLLTVDFPTCDAGFFDELASVLWHRARTGAFPAAPAAAS